MSHNECGLVGWHLLPKEHQPFGGPPKLTQPHTQTYLEHPMYTYMYIYIYVFYFSAGGMKRPAEGSQTAQQFMSRRNHGQATKGSGPLTMSSKNACDYDALRVIVQTNYQLILISCAPQKFRGPLGQESSWALKPMKILSKTLGR